MKRLISFSSFPPARILLGKGGKGRQVSGRGWGKNECAPAQRSTTLTSPSHMEGKTKETRREHVKENQEKKKKEEERGNSRSSQTKTSRTVLTKRTWETKKEFTQGKGKVNKGES